MNIAWFMLIAGLILLAVGITLKFTLSRDKNNEKQINSAEDFDVESFLAAKEAIIAKRENRRKQKNNRKKKNSLARKRILQAYNSNNTTNNTNVTNNTNTTDNANNNQSRQVSGGVSPQETEALLNNQKKLARINSDIDELLQEINAKEKVLKEKIKNLNQKSIEDLGGFNQTFNQELQNEGNLPDKYHDAIKMYENNSSLEDIAGSLDIGIRETELIIKMHGNGADDNAG